MFPDSFRSSFVFSEEVVVSAAAESAAAVDAESEADEPQPLNTAVPKRPARSNVPHLFFIISFLLL